ncbi:hypothetical protein BT96DRAFT_554556 [Gymnopus androsaceus JB14]|uniref:Uncharacterized protein n=1 Tax=Gymnopus androsaceus JB14 TaxID=1447944 RepID=A0A6A4I0V5_9AGAR|nr:hypothetical protein BT96DRAFT_554556 [Gymnopus androsaceus JB14]
MRSFWVMHIGMEVSFLHSTFLTVQGVGCVTFWMSAWSSIAIIVSSESLPRIIKNGHLFEQSGPVKALFFIPGVIQRAVILSAVVGGSNLGPRCCFLHYDNPSGQSIQSLLVLTSHI